MTDRCGPGTKVDRGVNGKRGVSDVLGFVLVFSLIVATLGFVYVGGFGALQDARQAEQANNAERAFEVLAANVEDVRHGGAPSRGTEIQLGDARIGYADPVTFNVSFEKTGRSFSATITPVVYDTGEGVRILYVDGAVIRDQKRGAVMLRQPGFVIGNRTVVPYVVTRPTGRTSVAGSGRVVVRTDVAVRNVRGYTTPAGNTYNVTLTISDTPRAAVWERYLRAKPGVTCPGDPGPPVTCEFRTERVYVQVVQLDVEIL